MTDPLSLFLQKQRYKGPTLAQVLADVAVPPRAVDKPLRLIVRDVFRPAVSAGRVVQGTLRVGQVVTLAPRMITTTVRQKVFCLFVFLSKKNKKVESIQMRGKAVESASAGDVVGVVLRDVEWCELDRAAVIGDAADPPRVCAQFVAKVIPYNCSIAANYTPLVLCHAASVPCAFVRVLSKTDKKTKEVTEYPQSLGNHENGQVEREEKEKCFFCYFFFFSSRCCSCLFVQLFSMRLKPDLRVAALQCGTPLEPSLSVSLMSALLIRAQSAV